MPIFPERGEITNLLSGTHAGPTFINISVENEALENEDQSTKHSNLENEAPIENEALEKEALKSRNHCRLNDYNFTSSMTQSESGGGSGCVRTSKGRQNPSQGFIKACKLFN